MSRSTRKIGKSEVRKTFLGLVNQLANQSGAIEITDHGRPVAVLMGYKTYQQILQKAKVPGKPRFKLEGSMTLTGDIEQGSKEITQQFMASIDRSAADL